MKTFLLIIAGIIVFLVAIKLLPLLLVPLGAGAGLTALLGLLILAFVVAALVGTLGFVVGALAVLVAIAAVLSPIWIPILVICGLIALVRRFAGKPA